MHLSVFFVLSSILYIVSVHCHFECEKTATVCETSLIISHTLTLWHPEHQYVLPYKGKLYPFNIKNLSTAAPVPHDDVITADGWGTQRMVLVANNSLPGPNIIVYEGQRVKVKVFNQMNSEVTSIHWHGIRQKDTPWMDGAAYVTQCPILPGHSFIYEFVADRRGTYMYHSHIKMQRTDGLLGGLIVRDRYSQQKEHSLIIQGWNHDQSAQKDYQGVLRGHFLNGKEVGHSLSLAGAEFDKFRLTSVLINGRGRYYQPPGGTHNGAPLTVVEVEQGEDYRLRFIGGGSLYPYRVSVDGHTMKIVASDGFDIQPVECESLIITTGERYDVIINANQQLNNYWIRAETLEVEPKPHHVEAILRYKGAADTDPLTVKKTCTASDKCVVVNCPFKYYPPSQNTVCKMFDELKSDEISDPVPVAADEKSFKEYFLNFAFPGSDDPFPPPGSVNGRVFMTPKMSALTQPIEVTDTCDQKDCGENKLCHCTNAIAMNKDDVVQFVITNLGTGEGEDHPIHMHGYSFYVLKMGFAQYNQTTGQVIDRNQDIDCRGGDQSTTFCNDATWRNTAWAKGGAPSMNLINPPRKDTINVPTGSYAVIRIKADNPGLWMLHCHIDIHSTAGMALLLNDSFTDIMKPPAGFPECREFGSPFGVHVPPTKPEDEENNCKTKNNSLSAETIWIVVVILIIVILGLIYTVIHLIGKLRKIRSKSYTFPAHTRASVTNSYDDPDKTGKVNPVFTTT